MVPPLFGNVRCPVFYFSQHRFVQVEVSVNLAERSRRDARLRWRATAPDGRVVGHGLTTLRRPVAVLRLYWPRWDDGRYGLHLTLERNGQVLARAEEAIRLVMNPWGE